VLGMKRSIADTALFLQQLGHCVTNNWHPYATVKASKGQQRYTKIDTIWATERAAVEEELKEILGVAELDPLAQEYFEKRTAAAKHVYDQMDELRKKEIDDVVKKRKGEANELDIQQRWVVQINVVTAHVMLIDVDADECAYADRGWGSAGTKCQWM
jgi:hypothetical protein